MYKYLTLLKHRSVLVNAAAQRGGKGRTFQSREFKLNIF
jgi:hypothetical protein